MTASTVAQVRSYIDAVSNVSSSKGASADDFSKVFAQSSAAGKDSVKGQETNSRETKDMNARQSDKTGKDEPLKKAQDNVKETKQADVKEQKADVTDETAKTDENEQEVMEAVGSAWMADITAALQKVQEMAQLIQDMLGISKEDLSMAMESLHMKPMDLLQAENIPKLTVALTDGADEISVMTDENLFANVKELMQTAKELLSELSDETKTDTVVLASMVEEMPQEVSETEDILPQQKAEESPQTPQKEEQNTDQPSVETNTVQETPEMIRQIPKAETGSKRQQQKEGGDISFSQMVTEQIKDAVGKTQTVTSASYADTMTQSIMDQITEAMKVTVKEDMTQMELQLHPASLGNIRVQVAAKEGVITATFTTQNEQVKAALESQMAVLKENFEQQGIKVEAVEVAVASHAFEENLSKEGESRTGQEPEKKKGARRIDLSNITDDFEEDGLEGLLEEDKIVADMMRKNGNTVDYTA